MLHTILERLREPPRERELAGGRDRNRLLEIDLPRRLHLDGHGFQLLHTSGANAEHERNVRCRLDPNFRTTLDSKNEQYEHQ